MREPPWPGGLTVWFTGLPSAGKSSVAAAVGWRLRAKQHRIQILDGDEMRAGLCSDLGFSRADRMTNVRRIGWVARLLAGHGIVVLVPVIAPYAATRAEVRDLHERAGIRYLEVHVDTPVEECARRDVKGLRPAARRRARRLTGVDDPYEPPTAPELRLRTVGRGVEECAAEVLDLLTTRASHLGCP